MSKVIVNDEQQEVTLPLSLIELMKQNNVLQPEMVSVQINEEFIRPSDFEATLINDGDVIDFLYFMGGGQ